MVSGIYTGGTGVDTYESKIEWNYGFGIRIREEDQNGQAISYQVDDYGRIESIRSPYDGAVPAIAYEYNAEPGTNWYAVTRNKIHFAADRDAALDTVVMIDGLGRAVYTAKQAEVEKDDGREYAGWNLSGAVSYDGKGRTVQEGQIRFVAGALEQYTFSDGLRNPTVTEYDTLDRITGTTLPDENEWTTAYGIENGYMRELSVDPLGNKTLKETDSRGNIMGVTRYDRDGREQTRAAYEYNFTGKELDSETGLYYYGARYLDPKTSRWLSGDPAVGDYIPGAPVNDEARKRNGNLPGQGGIFNTVNLHLYHYAGNNPVKYMDPDGRNMEDFDDLV
jgi:RHS repeat-associated protein